VSLVSAAGLAFLILPMPDSTAATVSSTPTFTWTGTASAAGQANWSDGTNWEGGTAPSAPGPVDLVFPKLKCKSGATCGNISDNDLTGLTVTKLRLDIGVAKTYAASARDSYNIEGNGITIDGLIAKTDLVKGDYYADTDSLALPIALGGSQKWSLDVGDGANLDFSTISGTANLTVEMSGGGFPVFEGNVNVGTLVFSGAGVVAPEQGVSLNSNGNPVDLTDTFFFALGATTGPLTSTSSEVQLGNGGGTGPYGIEAVDGSASFDSASTISLWSLEPGTGSKPVAGAGYPQLRASGSVSLGSAGLSTFAGCNQELGLVYTIVKAGGGLSGRFHGIKNGAIIQAQADDEASCSAAGATPPYLRYRYNDKKGTVTATTVAPPPTGSARAHQSLVLRPMSTFTGIAGRPDARRT
jgi:hypothetical protein